MKITSKTQIAILLATYNAEKYLAEQIDSIIRQSCSDWTLYIQDDGSKDGTSVIIDDYVRKYPDKIVRVDLGLTRQGCCNNFMSLLNVVESKYYMFCDQDDVWLPEKIALSLSMVQKIESENTADIPVLVHTDRTFAREDLSVLKSEWNPRHKSAEVVKKKIRGLIHPESLAIYNICAGNTMCFNQAAKAVSFPFINIRVHDSNVAMAVANHHGIIGQIYESTVLYRMHAGQTCGVRDGRISRKILHIFSVLAENMKGFYIWKIYGKGSFFRFLYFRIRYFLLLRFY